MAQVEVSDPENPLHRLSPDQIEQLGHEFDALHDEVFADLGERDAIYIRSMISFHRRLVLIGRALLIGSRYRPLWLAGTATLSVAKILENMEIGHNVMHGQWDWMNDPVINSSAWDWDSASTAEAWKHSHNYVHHTYTNIRGLDHDLGYEIMRIDPHQKWNPIYVLQPLYNLALMAFFEWGVAFHDLNFDEIRSGKKSREQVRRELKGMAVKARAQIVKDYVAFPALSGLLMLGIDLALATRSAELDELTGETRGARAKRAVRAALGGGQQTESKGAAIVRKLVERRSFRQPFRSTLSADFTANIVRNLWAHAIIFCGHFPDQTFTFSQQETAEESRGGRHVRQLLGSANIEGSPLFHVLSGNLGYQVEHHLFPDMPSTRYAEIAPRVKEICERYDLPYNSGPFGKQWGMVQRTIIRLSMPGGKPRAKPGPYRSEHREGEVESALAGAAR
ncbi:MAG: fatty acid desaturase family protein [Solirubrobacteraceae bacterium]